MPGKIYKVADKLYPVPEDKNEAFLNKVHQFGRQAEPVELYKVGDRVFPVTQPKLQAFLDYTGRIGLEARPFPEPPPPPPPGPSLIQRASEIPGIKQIGQALGDRITPITPATPVTQQEPTTPIRNLAAIMGAAPATFAKKPFTGGGIPGGDFIESLKRTPVTPEQDPTGKLAEELAFIGKGGTAGISAAGGLLRFLADRTKQDVAFRDDLTPEERATAEAQPTPQGALGQLVAPNLETSGRFLLEQAEERRKLLEQIRPTKTLITEKGVDWKVAKDPGYWKDSIGETVVSMATALAAGGGTPVGAALAGSVMEAGPMYAELADKGDPNAALKSVAFGAVVAGLEKIGFDNILDKLPKGGKAKAIKILTNALVEGFTETAEEPAQAVIEILDKEGLTLSELGKTALDASLQGLNTFIPAAVTGGGTTAINALAEGKEAPESPVEAPVQEPTATPEPAQATQPEQAPAQPEAAKPPPLPQEQPEITEPAITEEDFPADAVAVDEKPAEISEKKPVSPIDAEIEAPITEADIPAEAVEVKQAPKQADTLEEQVHLGQEVKAPKEAAYVRVTDAQGREAIVRTKDIDTLEGAGPYKSVEFGNKTKKGFVPLEKPAEASKTGDPMTDLKKMKDQDWYDADIEVKSKGESFDTKAGKYVEGINRQRNTMDALIACLKE